jgi:hypothetical protein
MREVNFEGMVLSCDLPDNTAIPFDHLRFILKPTSETTILGRDCVFSFE